MIQCLKLNFLKLTRRILNVISCLINLLVSIAKHLEEHMVPMKKELTKQQDRMKEIKSGRDYQFKKEAYEVHYNCKKNVVQLVEAMVAAGTSTRLSGSGDNSAETEWSTNLEKTKCAVKISWEGGRSTKEYIQT